MALRDLQTVFKSLKFGHDRLGGGDSGLPYIQTPIIEDESKLNFLRFNPDFPIRGGLLSGLRTGQDLERFGKFLIDPVRGPLFITKQVGLQLTNPKIEVGKQIGLENTRIYNLGANTMSQIAGEAFGLHFQRHGLLLYTPEDETYAKFVPKKDTYSIGDTENRLVNLYGIKILKDSSFNERAQKMGISLDDNQIMNYKGGPGSFLGIGNTVIHKAENRYTPEPNKTVSLGKGVVDYSKTIGLSKKYGSKNVNTGIDPDNPTQKPSQFAQSGKNAKDIINLNIRNGTGNESKINTWTSGMYNDAFVVRGNSTNNIQDFRKILVENGSLTPSKQKSIPNFDYTNNNIKRQTRVLTGDPGIRGVSRVNYEKGTGNTATQDRINMLPLYESSTPLPVDYTRDLVKFRFEIINNDDPTKAVYIHFRAFLTSIQDNYNPEWSDFSYIGRGEKFHTYNGYSRNISFGFRVHAQSREEMKPMYQKLNYLASSMAPDYNSDKFMRGNIIKVTLGDYIYSQPGIINSLNYKIDGTAPWEIAMQEPESTADNDMHELPHLIDVDVTFTPIHNFVPKKNATLPFITPYNLAEGNAFLWSKAKNNPNLIHKPGEFTGGQTQNLAALLKKS